MNLFEKQNKPFAIKLSDRVKDEIKKEFGSKRWNFQITNYFIYVNQDTWSFSINLPNHTLITEADFFGDGNNKLREISKEVIFSKYNLENLSEEEKENIIREFSELVAFQCLDLFNALGLNSHIECMVKNTANDKEYILSFKTLDKFLKDKKDE